MEESVKGLMNSISLGDFASYCVVIVGIISLIIEKSRKLPFNPWSSLFKWIGSKINESLYDEISELKEQQESTKEYITSLKEDYNKRMDALERHSDEKEAKRLRSNIICFSDSCRIGTHHTKNHFENIFRDYDDYKDYCKVHKFENHFIDGEMSYIESIYDKCLRENKFL